MGSGGVEGGREGREGRQAYGLAGRELAARVDEIAAWVGRFEPGVTGARDCVDLVAELSRLEHLASAGLSLAAKRVAGTDLWRRSGHATAAQWLSQVCGSSVGEAVGLLEAAEVIESAPDTREALRAGAVSTRQAKAIGAAEKADSAAGRRLIEGAGTRSTKQTEAESRRIVAAARGESPVEKAARHHRVRRVWHGVDAEGMGVGGWRLPIAAHTRFVAQLEAEQSVVFDEMRVAGEREPAQAYAADAFCRILDRAGARDTERAGGGGGEDWSFTKVIVKVDLAALDRGEVAPGEVCEIAGQGPVPVADVWRMIDGDAFVAAVTTRGTEISKVVHLGRRPTVLQRTALDWLADGGCQIEGCTSRARLEIDHVAEWAATGRTQLTDLARVCGHHHDLKTHRGHTFGPLTPDGTRRLIPPAATGPPGTADRHDDRLDDRAPKRAGPDRVAVAGRARSTPPPTVSIAERSEQRGLFDTG